jgi:hypothetical protein
MAQVVEGADQLADQIMAAYDQYQSTLEAQNVAIYDLRTAEMDLEAAQDAVLLDEGSLDGKNAEIRAAQLRARTERQYLECRAADLRLQQARIRTTARYELLRTLRALSSLLSGTSHA